MVVYACHPSYVGRVNRRIVIQAGPRKNLRPRAGGMIQVKDHLPSKCEALNSNPSTAKSKQEQ
jgi:hypothetical protein